MSFDYALPKFWYWSTLNDIKADGRSIVSGPFGSNIGKRFFVDAGVPVIRGNNLSLGMERFKDEGFVFLTEEKASEFKNCEAHPGDILFTAAGTIGQVGIIPFNGKHRKYIISNKQLRARLDSQKVNSLFAYYWFSSPEMVAAIQSRNTGSTIPLINLSVIKSLPIPIPPLSEQIKIVECLSLLDERINHLHETNGTLEAIAQALFKSWFVDFDPVRAKMEGRAPENMDEATAALFPSELEQSTLGFIPKGWSLGTLHMATSAIFSGGTPDTRKPNFWGGELPWFSSGETRNLVVVDTEKRITQAGVDESSTKPVRPGDILIASAGQGHTRGQTSYCGIDCYINQSVVALRAGSLCKPSWLFFNLARRYDEMRNLSDSQSSRGSLTTKLLGGMPLVMPPLGVIDTFDSVASPILASIISNSKQSQALAAIRDTLLPRLISGQLRLCDLEEIEPIAA